MRENITHAVEDYLKAVFELTRNGGRASTTDLAEMLEVTPASVTGMVQKLSATQPPLLEYKKHKGAALTQDGEKVALETIRHHRLIEMFLQETLGYSWDEVHKEADQLEHVISEDFEERVARFLGNPTHDPHGDPIPSRELKLPPSSGIRLCELRPGDVAKVKRVRDDDPELLRHLSSLGLKPPARVQVMSYSPLDENLTLKIEGRSEPAVLGKRITSLVYAEKE
jgi:DtxR family Mn-dependent transcriptional regulator